MLAHRSHQSAASALVIGLPQVREFRRDQIVRSAADIGGGRPIHVAEKSKHYGAENCDTDQRQLECRGPQGLSQQHGRKTRRHEPYEGEDRLARHRSCGGRVRHKRR